MKQCDCTFCYQMAISHILVNVKGKGDKYFPVCADHLNGVRDWREINDMMAIMGLKSTIRPASQIKYCKVKIA